MGVVRDFLNLDLVRWNLGYGGLDTSSGRRHGLGKHANSSRANVGNSTSSVVLATSATSTTINMSSSDNKIRGAPAVPTEKSRCGHADASREQTRPFLKVERGLHARTCRLAHALEAVVEQGHRRSEIYN